MTCELSTTWMVTVLQFCTPLTTPRDTPLQPYFYNVIFSDNKISIKSLWGNLT